jgi:hypothetical protein
MQDLQNAEGGSERDIGLLLTQQSPQGKTLGKFFFKDYALSDVDQCVVS